MVWFGDKEMSEVIYCPYCTCQFFSGKDLASHLKEYNPNLTQLNLADTLTLEERNKLINNYLRKDHVKKWENEVKWRR